jgi:GT2 family glycosyltransferase
MGTWPRDTVREVDIVSGCFFLMRRKDWDDLDGLDPVFAMYGEEVDLCLRARARGFQPIVTPEATIVHYAGASEAVRSDKMVRLMRAKIALIKRHFPPLTRGLGQALFSLWPWSRKTAMGIGAKLLGKDSLKQRADTWGEIWDRRAEWKNGFDAD